MEPTTHTEAPERTASQSLLKRELNGATFLTLEHIAHMLLVLVVPTLFLTGLAYAFSLWTNTPGLAMMMSGMPALYSSMSSSVLNASAAIGVVAALVALAPALIVFDRRTRAEWRKRPGYAGRLAYKVPVYATLALLGLTLVCLKIQMLYVILTSIAYIGLENAPIGQLYLTIFLPCLVAYLVYGLSAFYVFKLAKGHDHGRRFSFGFGALSLVLAVSLFITSLVVLHNGDNGFTVPGTTNNDSTIERDSNSDTDYDFDEDYQKFLDEIYR